MKRKQKRRLNRTQDDDEENEVDDVPVPREMKESGRRRSARLNGEKDGEDGSTIEVNTKPRCGRRMGSRNMATMSPEVMETESIPSLIVKLRLPPAALRYVRKSGTVFSPHEEAEECAPQALPVAAEPETMDSRKDSISPSKPEFYNLSQSPPKCDITKSPEMSPPLHADAQDYLPDAATALPPIGGADDRYYLPDRAPPCLPITYPPIPRTIPWNTYLAFDISLPLEQTPPAFTPATQFQSPAALPSAPPRMAEPYHSAAPSMLAEVLEITRHQARLQVLQSSALQCLSDYHYWSIHNPILCVPYKAFFRRLERELKAELEQAERNGKLIEEMGGEKGVGKGGVRRSDGTAIELQGEGDIELGGEVEDAPAMTVENGDGDTALPGTCGSLKRSSEEIAAKDSLSIPPDETMTSTKRTALELSLPGEGISKNTPWVAYKTPAPGPLEMEIRAELQQKKGNGITTARTKVPIIVWKMKAPTTTTTTKKKPVKIQINPPEARLVHTPAPTSIRNGKSNQTTKASTLWDLAERSNEGNWQEGGTLQHVEEFALQNLVANGQPQQAQFTPQHYQSLTAPQHVIPQDAYPQPLYGQQQQLQPQLEYSLLPSQEHPFAPQIFHQLPEQHIPQWQASIAYAVSAPCPYPPRKKPWQASYHEERDLILDPPPTPASDWNAVHSWTNPPALGYYLRIGICRQQFTNRLKLLLGHLKSLHQPRPRNVKRVPSRASQSRSSNFVFSHDYEERLDTSGKSPFLAFVQPWKWPTEDPTATFQSAGKYRMLLWQHPLTLDLPTEFLEQGALEPPPSDSWEESSPPRKINRTSYHQRLSACRLEEAPEITAISSDEESCNGTIFSPHVLTEELVPPTGVPTDRAPSGKRAISRTFTQLLHLDRDVHGDNISGILTEAAENRGLVAPVASMYTPPEFESTAHETPGFLGAESPGEWVNFGETNNDWQFSMTMNNDCPPWPRLPEFENNGMEGTRTLNQATIMNRVPRLPIGKWSSNRSSRLGVHARSLEGASSRTTAPTRSRTNTSQAPISDRPPTASMISQAPAGRPTTPPVKATYTGPPIIIPRTLLQQPPINTRSPLPTSQAKFPHPITTPSSRPINLGKLLKNIHPPLPGRNTSRRTSANPPTAPNNPRGFQNRPPGPVMTAAAKKQITIRKNAEARRMLRESGPVEKEAVGGDDKGKELTAADLAKQIIARKYGERGAKRIYLTPEEIAANGGASGDDERRQENGKAVDRLVLDERVGHEGELLPIDVAEAMRRVPGKQKKMPKTEML